MTTRRKLGILMHALAAAAAEASNNRTPFLCHVVSVAIHGVWCDPPDRGPECAAVMKHLAVTARKMGGTPDKYVWWEIPDKQRDTFLHTDSADRAAIRRRYCIEPRLECLKQTIKRLQGYKGRDTRPDLTHARPRT